MLELLDLQRTKRMSNVVRAYLAVTRFRTRCSIRFELAQGIHVEEHTRAQTAAHVQKGRGILWHGAAKARHWWRGVSEVLPSAASMATHQRWTRSESQGATLGLGTHSLPRRSMQNYGVTIVENKIAGEINGVLYRLESRLSPGHPLHKPQHTYGESDKPSDQRYQQCRCECPLS